MEYPIADNLINPVSDYTVDGYGFKEHVPRRFGFWATHLGDDVKAQAGTPVQAIGAGQVVWAEMRLGSPERKNWGGIVVVAHANKANQQPFYSLYGHLASLSVKVGDVVSQGQRLGEVAPGSTPENGYWKTSHLHFAIYTGPWRNQILPGHKRIEEFRTLVRWWRNPKEFIQNYNA